MANARQLLHNVTFFQYPYECARGAEVVVLMTDWDCLLDLDFGRLAAIMRRNTSLICAESTTATCFNDRMGLSFIQSADRTPEQPTFRSRRCSRLAELRYPVCFRWQSVNLRT